MQRSKSPCVISGNDTSEPVQDTGIPRAILAISDGVSSAFHRLIAPTPDGYAEKTITQHRPPIASHDQFAIEEVYSTSTEGTVSVARSTVFNVKVICKHTNAHAQNEEDFEKSIEQVTQFRYPNEANILCSVLKPSPSIVSIADVRPDTHEHGRYHIYMEFCTGGSLFDIMAWWYEKRRQPIPETLVLHAFVGMAEALAYIHFGLRYRGDGRYYQDKEHRQIIHGDMKEENIFIRWSQDPIGLLPDIVLGDFGTAKVATDRNARLGPGTFEYHAPEDVAIYGADFDWNRDFTFANRHLIWQMIDSRTTAVDVYAMGLTMYKMITNEPSVIPIGTDPATLRWSRRYETPGLTDAIAACLNVDPTRRAEMSFREGVGLLPLIHDLRQARDAMIERHGGLDPLDFDPKFGPPRPRRN